jgi:hypothetical protein
MTQDQMMELAENCGFTRTHSGEVELWLCNKNDLSIFMRAVAEDAYHNGLQRGVVVGAENEREICALICDKEVEEWKYDADVVDVSLAIRARSKE